MHTEVYQPEDDLEVNSDNNELIWIWTALDKASTIELHQENNQLPELDRMVTRKKVKL